VREKHKKNSMCVVARKAKTPGFVQHQEAVWTDNKKKNKEPGWSAKVWCVNPAQSTE